MLDADGVVINKELFSRQLERDYGISHEIAQEFFLGVFQQCLVGKQDLKQVLVPYLKKWGWPGSVEDFLNYWFESEHSINDNVMKTVAKCRGNGVPCYVATNQEKYRTEYMKQEMGFANSFDGVFSSAYLGCRKPDRKFFSLLYDGIARKNVAKSDVVFWDDDVKNVNAAKDFGFDAYLFSSADFERIMQDKFAMTFS